LLLVGFGGQVAYVADFRLVDEDPDQSEFRSGAVVVPGERASFAIGFKTPPRCAPGFWEAKTRNRSVSTDQGIVTRQGVVIFN